MAGSGGRVVHASTSCAIINTSSTSCNMYLVLMIYDAGLNVKGTVTYDIRNFRSKIDLNNSVKRKKGSSSSDNLLSSNSN